VSVPALPLVGRTEELSSLERALEELNRGRSGAIELVGEPGIGKTRLLRELTDRAEARGQLVLAGAGSELEHDLPFSVLVDALDDYLQALDPGWSRCLDESSRNELAHVFPSLCALAKMEHVAFPHERYRTHRALRALLEGLAQSEPLVLILDDLHWADSASVEVLGSLLHRPPAAAVLLALAHRPRQPQDRLAAALERAYREEALGRIVLEPLSSEDSRELLGDAIDGAAAAMLYELSGGNPFYLEELARSLRRAGRATSLGGTPTIDIGIPAPVAASLGEELALLSAGVRLVLQGAAVAGDPFEPELVAAAAGTSEPAAIDAIDELLQLEVVRATDAPRRFRFRHPLVRRVVYETAAPGWRLGAHERCAVALAARGAPAVARAYHVERSAREGDLNAVAVLREAGEASARLGPASAARWFAAALRLLPQSAPHEERVALLMARAANLAAAGHPAESHADLLDCVELVRQGADGWRLRVTTACAAVERLLGLQTKAHRHLVSAVDQLSGTESAESVELKIELAANEILSSDVGAARACAEGAVSAATSWGDPVLLAAALATRAWASAIAVAGSEAQTHCDEATQLIEALADDELARRLDALAHLATAELYLDRFRASTRHAQRALQIGRATRQGDLFPLIVLMLGGSLSILGRPSQAEELLNGAVEAARLAGNVYSLAWNLFNRSFAALVAGDLDCALATAEESCRLVEGMEPGPISALAASTLATALLETGHADRSVELLLTRAGGEELRLIGGGWRARCLEVLTRALLATGRRADAARAAAAAHECADSVSLPTAAAMANLAAAALALDAGEPKAAAERALAAAVQLEAAEAMFDAARAREFAGRALAQAGDRDRAAGELEYAAAAFDSMGSLRYRNEAERELRKLGRHIHHRTRRGTADGTGLETLTARELEVARLVVDRRTNPEIAAELFLSQKTVETHLRNIFRKMDVSSRVALARAIEQADHTRAAQPRPLQTTGP
jgi:DNA-binding NarL/FixJ family response regulator